MVTVMNRPAQTQLVPVQEMTPANVATIRNSVINQLVAMVSRDLMKSEDELIVRDILPYTDLNYRYATATTTSSTAEQWIHDVTTTSIGYNTVTGASTMADQRYVAIFGVRDTRLTVGVSASGGTTAAGMAKPWSLAAAIKFEVGGRIAAIWHIESMMAYRYNQAAFSPAAIVIPQNTAFNIYYYMKNTNMTVGTGAVGQLWLQLVGVTVEPRGKTVTP